MNNYNIHVHVHDNGGSTNTSGRDVNTIESFIDKIKNCYNWESFCKLDFNHIGMHVMCDSDRMMLCRVENGIPKVKNIIDDYIFVASRSKLDNEITPRAFEIIEFFIRQNHGPACVVKSPRQGYNDNFALYGKSVGLCSEGVILESQNIGMISRLIDG